MPASHLCAGAERTVITCYHHNVPKTEMVSTAWLCIFTLQHIYMCPGVAAPKEMAGSHDGTATHACAHVANVMSTQTSYSCLVPSSTTGLVTVLPLTYQPSGWLPLPHEDFIAAFKALKLSPKWLPRAHEWRGSLYKAGTLNKECICVPSGSG